MMNFTQCVTYICQLLDSLDKGEVSVESARITATGIIGQYSDATYERIKRAVADSAVGKNAKTDC